MTCDHFLNNTHKMLFQVTRIFTNVLVAFRYCWLGDSHKDFLAYFKILNKFFFRSSSSSFDNDEMSVNYFFSSVEFSEEKKNCERNKQQLARLGSLPSTTIKLNQAKDMTWNSSPPDPLALAEALHGEL